MSSVITIILGGGKGSRLFPLTRERAKPAVPFGGKFRLIDIAISNSINSGFRKIYILTQFESTSLNHHISQAYQFDVFSKGFVEVLAATQNLSNGGWYEGTADAVRKNLFRFKSIKPSHYIILSGDQLYRMNLADFLEKHLESGAEISIAATPVDRRTANELGILKIDKNSLIEEFIEKPGPDRDISGLKIPCEAASAAGVAPGTEKEYLASMGIYIFSAAAMEDCLQSDATDFGKGIIPESLGMRKMRAYVYNGYWEDIGTISSFYEANLNLASWQPSFNLYDEGRPVYTYRSNLPPSKINSCTFKEALASEGSIITDAFIRYSLVGVRTIINSGASLDGVYCMGSDFYETAEDIEHNRKNHVPNIGIGSGVVIKRAIIDKNARIGNYCRIGVDSFERKDGDYGAYHIVDGIIIIHKDAILHDATVI
ncbi:MAG: glucose-1-phosphate adenylyltransferase [Spirochaetales bacterium]|jgi:glucose-1-phosphate adenylyltransferase|nr:glucose-1-phosphate adenylyltransferase [Spirochaetales bacterium]